jgi:hypothetical protein
VGAAVESYGAWRVVFEDDFSVGCVVFVFECCFSSHVGLVLSVGFVLSVGQLLRSRSRDTDAQARRTLARLSSVALGVSVVCVPHYLGLVAQGSRSICFQGSTFRNVRLNADRLHDIVAYPRCRVFPVGTVQLVPGLMTISVWSDVLGCMSNYVTCNAQCKR